MKNAELTVRLETVISALEQDSQVLHSTAKQIQDHLLEFFLSVESALDDSELLDTLELEAKRQQALGPDEDLRSQLRVLNQTRMAASASAAQG